MKKLSRTKIRKEWIWAYVFIAPMFIGTLIFGLFPIVYSFVLSVTDWNLLSGFGGFVGLKNFATVFTSKTTLAEIRNTLVYAGVSVPITLLLSVFCQPSQQETQRKKILPYCILSS